MYDIIRKKRDGGELTEEEIRFFTQGCVDGSIPDYQAAALLMAVFLQGMSEKETALLTYAIRDSGEKLDFSEIDGVRADKHSTGGVGDKTSLIVAPIAASLGLKVAKISGRGLGHTGGTVDKLESIPGFKTDLSEREFISVVNRTGVAIIGQSRNIAPADKILYGIRDVTATIDSLPLIVSSIMGKKLAADDDCIVLDVKTGSGSFMKSVEESRNLARAMVNIGRAAGKKIMAFITDMDRPLGNAVGNALEVKEAIKTLRGEGPEDLTELSAALAAAMLYLGGKGTQEECLRLSREAMKNGTALAKFREMVTAQGGNGAVADDPELLGAADFTREVKAPRDGYISAMDTEGIGTAAMLLGAGRMTMDDRIDMLAGITLHAKTGDLVRKGETIAVLYTSREEKLPAAAEKFMASVAISAERPACGPVILDTIE